MCYLQRDQDKKRENFTFLLIFLHFHDSILATVEEQLLI